MGRPACWWRACLLVAVATGVAMATGTGSGATSGWLEIIAALAAITAGALAVPLLTGDQALPGYG